ncbi:fungal-specific transcription factor domain-containing protein [Lipomyces kononenkoae]|uniref:Fungal-specific transcription factor domain-containing protein n=1 Tax=Lipomyces kononenkoae TaxID=34357 RepID=A0ACC3T1K5_LIPKO
MDTHTMLETVNLMEQLEREQIQNLQVVSPVQSISPAASSGSSGTVNGKTPEKTPDEDTKPQKRRRVGLKRSREGCLQCRQRRKKCGLDRPACKSCVDRDWVCVYPSPTAQVSDVVVKSPTVRRMSSVSSRTDALPSEFTSTIFSTAFSDEGSVDAPLFEDSLAVDSLTPSTSLVPSPSMAALNSLSLPMPSMATMKSMSLNIENLDGLDPLSILNYTRTQKELVYYFTMTIASVISYYRQEGPFKRLILSMLIPASKHGAGPSSPTGPLLSSLCALASTHKSYALGNVQDDQQLSYHTAALEKLITHLEDLPARLEDESTQNVLLSSILILVYYEIAKGGYIDAISLHLSGAYRIITSFLNHVIFRLQASNTTGMATSRVSKETIFLFRIFQYFDVICSLSKRDKLLDRSLQLHHFLSTYARLRPTTTATFQSGFPDDGIDPVIGLAEDLWPLIVRLCILCNDSGFGKTLTPDIMCQASLLELELSSWEVPASLSTPSTPQDLAMQAAAKVYQLAAQIYLLRTFFPSENVADAIQSHVRSALDHLARVCTLEGNMAALLWPVSVVASECVDSIDRGFVKVVFQKLGKRQGMANVMRGLQAVEAGWRGIGESAVVMFG